MSMDVMLMYMDNIIEHAAEIYNTTHISLTSVLHTFVICFLIAVYFNEVVSHVLFVLLKIASFATSKLKQIDFDGISKSFEGWAEVSSSLPQFILTTTVYFILAALEWLLHPFNGFTICRVVIELIERILVFIIYLPDACNAFLQRLADKIKEELTRPEKEFQAAEKAKEGEYFEGTERVRTEEEKAKEEEYWKGVWAKVPQEFIDPRPLVSELQFRINTPWNERKKVYPPPKGDKPYTPKRAHKPVIVPIETAIEDPTLEDDVKHCTQAFDERMQRAILNSLEINNNITPVKSAPVSILAAFIASCAAQQQLDEEELDIDGDDDDEYTDDEEETPGFFNKIRPNGLSVWDALAVAAVGVIVYKRFA